MIGNSKQDYLLGLAKGVSDAIEALTNRNACSDAHEDKMLFDRGYHEGQAWLRKKADTLLVSEFPPPKQKLPWDNER